MDGPNNPTLFTSNTNALRLHCLRCNGTPAIERLGH
jgi:hypothetical protein